MFGVVACLQEVAITPGELLADADLIHYTMGASEKDEEEAIRKAVDFSTTARRQIGPACLARLASGKGNWDQPNHTTCRGWAIWEDPTYSAFWGVFGVTCLRMQRLTSLMGFGNGTIGTQEEPAVFRRNTRVCSVLRDSGREVKENPARSNPLG